MNYNRKLIRYIINNKDSSKVTDSLQSRELVYELSVFIRLTQTGTAWPRPRHRTRHGRGIDAAASKRISLHDFKHSNLSHISVCVDL